jgi:hypothetical protein
MGTLDVSVTKNVESDSHTTTAINGISAPFNYDSNYNYKRGEFVYGILFYSSLAYMAGAMKGEKVALGAGTYVFPKIRLA